MNIKTLMLIAMVISIDSANAATVLGNVYPVIEHDPVEVIKERARAKDWDSVFKNRKDSWRTRWQTTQVPRAEKDRERKHSPLYTVKHEVADQNGKVIYPVGYQYNPLSYLTMPYTLYVVDEKDLEWLKPQLKLGDKVLINSGDISKASTELKRPTYLLDDKTRQALSIEAVPTIVTQKGDAYLIREVRHD